MEIISTTTVKITTTVIATTTALKITTTVIATTTLITAIHKKKINTNTTSTTNM